MNGIQVIRAEANAKLNLYLDITGRRADGYHLLETVMQSITLADGVTVVVSAGNGISLSCDREDVPTDSRNTAYRAAEYFMEAAGVSGTVCIDIEKHIPSGAGMGGGSADAAAVLRALNAAYGVPLTEDSLLEIAARVGADVPFCLVGGTRLCRGIGEQMSGFPAPEGVFLVVKPEFSCPTGEAYRKYDGSPLPVHGGLEGFRAALPGGYATEMYNVFQRLYSDRRIEDICRRLREAGAKGAILTGSGSACFGVFGSREDAESASAQFADCFTAVCGAAEQGILISEKEVL
ncbi:MAG: 4-(cytidine 5'-diphospho)-2-C-methyl-D-erythritol kinase [Ruminococcaceae bacterium]|nr:4-(cytidine 5'-diphospho)-2-C-methyl-D-erythritol kinase [Oscillospiraceae bacterium]